MPRYRNVREKYRAVLHYTGSICLIGAAVILLPLAVIPFFPEEAGMLLHFALPSLLLGAIGFYLRAHYRVSGSITLNATWGGIIVFMSWIIICLFSAFPLMSGAQLNFTGAVFESVSGWTTTGLSVLDVEKASHTILLWRSLMQLFGGAGLVIIMMTAIIGPLGPGLSVAEGRDTQLVPHVVHSTRIVARIYAVYALFGFFAYWIAGMSPFDAVNHSFAAISTGGFSTRAASIGYWNSPCIETVTNLLMIAGNMSFLTAYLLIRGKFRMALRDGEVKLLAAAVPLGALLLFFTFTGSEQMGFAGTFRAALFQSVTAITTTGFSTVPFSIIGPLGLFTIIVLMVIGGGTYSTAGGLKQIRVYLLLKSIIWNIRQRVLPHRSVVSNYYWKGEERKFINWETVGRMTTYMGLYMVTLMLGTTIIVAHGFSIADSLFEFSSALGTVGLSAGITAPDAPALVLWTETVGMFLGRLEFFVIITSLMILIRDSHLFLSRGDKRPIRKPNEG